MSYSRWSSDCDVYTFWNNNDKLECCGCSIIGHSVEFDTVGKFIEHLKEHVKLGHAIPEYLLDINTYDDFIKEVED